MSCSGLGQQTMPAIKNQCLLRHALPPPALPRWPRTSWVVRMTGMRSCSHDCVGCVKKAHGEAVGTAYATCARACVCVCVHVCVHVCVRVWAAGTHGPWRQVHGRHRGQDRAGQERQATLQSGECPVRCRAAPTQAPRRPAAAQLGRRACTFKPSTHPTTTNSNTHARGTSQLHEAARVK